MNTSKVLVCLHFELKKVWRILRPNIPRGRHKRLAGLEQIGKHISSVGVLWASLGLPQEGVSAGNHQVPKVT